MAETASAPSSHPTGIPTRDTNNLDAPSGEAEKNEALSKLSTLNLARLTPEKPNTTYNPPSPG